MKKQPDVLEEIQKAKKRIEELVKVGPPIQEPLKYLLCGSNSFTTMTSQPDSYKDKKGNWRYFYYVLIEDKNLKSDKCYEFKIDQSF